MARAGKRGFPGLACQALEIQRTDGTVLSSSSGTYTASVNCPLDVSGTHTIGAKSNSSTGAGEFGLYLQRVNNPLDVTTVGYGEKLTVSISAGQLEGFTLSGAAGEGL